MYILKRSLYYITRKKGKSITIGIILFVVATLILTGLLINNAANKTFEVAKNKLGSNIIYKSDTSDLIDNAMNTNIKQGERFNPGEISLPDDFTNITTKEIETIKLENILEDELNLRMQYLLAANEELQREGKSR